MWWGTVEAMQLIWWRMLLGAALLLVGVGAGWHLGRDPHLSMTRILAYWINRVVLPLVTSARCWIRFVVIAVNNGSILAVVVFFGRWQYLAIAVVGILGASLGISLRVLTAQTDALFDVGPSLGPSRHRRIRIGVALNLLEPPAILIALGLALARVPAPLSSDQTWATFLVWVLPATVAAAAGEATWLGVCVRARSGGAPEPGAPTFDDAEAKPTDESGDGNGGPTP